MDSNVWRGKTRVFSILVTLGPVGMLAATAGPALAAFPGMNGKVAFESNRDGNVEIYVMNGDGSGQTNLTNNPAADDDPAFSPDGTKIAFASARAGNREIYVVNADGTNLTRLTNHPADDIQPAFSPDGTKIAFSSNRDGNRDIYLMNADGTNPTRLTNHLADRAPAFSPDGTQITFRSDRDGNPEIYLMNADGTNQTNLTNNPAEDFAPAFSPDGTKIAFASTRDGNDEVYVMNVDGTDQTNLTNSPLGDNYPAFSPGGTKIAYRSARDGNREIYVMNADGSNQTRLTNDPAEDLDPDWGPLPSPNTAPTVDAGPDLGTDEGASVTLMASFSDPDMEDVHTATIDWGDGTGLQAGTVDQANDTVTVSHVYANDGGYTLTVTVSDGRGGVGQGAATVWVNNVPPTASAGGPYSGVVGSPITFSGTASDPGADALTFEWDFENDGVFDAVGPTVQHAYTQADVYTVTLQVTDDDSWTVGTTTATVTERPQVVMYLSLGSSATLPGNLSVANEDIVAFDGSAFSLYFDGSDVGLGSFTLDAFTVISATEILMSFTSAGTVGGVAMDDSDILEFRATSLGATTAGTFSMYFVGSDVGLSTDKEDVDAVELLADGRLLVSTTGSASVPGVSSGADEDLLEFTPTSLGMATAGSWRLHFDGSDVGLSSSSEDVDAVAVGGSGQIHLSTIGAFAVNEVSGADEDVFVFTPTSLGSTTQGTFAPALFFDGSNHGLVANDVFAIDLP